MRKALATLVALGAFSIISLNEHLFHLVDSQHVLGQSVAETRQPQLTRRIVQNEACRAIERNHTRMGTRRECWLRKLSGLPFFWR